MSQPVGMFKGVVEVDLSLLQEEGNKREKGSARESACPCVHGIHETRVYGEWVVGGPGEKLDKVLKVHVEVALDGVGEKQANTGGRVTLDEHKR